MGFVKIVYSKVFSDGPSGEGCGDGPLLSQRSFSVSLRAKVVYERVNVNVTQAQAWARFRRDGACTHVVSPFVWLDKSQTEDPTKHYAASATSKSTRCAILDF